MKKHLIVSLHDLHPGSLEAVRDQVAFCAGLGAGRFSILAVPRFHHGPGLEDDRATLSWLDERSAAGDDLVLHGFYHDRADRSGGSWFHTRIYTANEAEFLDLPEGEMERRLDEGMALWSRRGWGLRGFIAPAWLMPPSVDRALAARGFAYTTRLKGIHHLRDGRFTASQSLCYSTRSWWRVPVSLGWNRWLSGRLRSTRLIRLSLHPRDLEHVTIRKQVGRILEMALAEGFEPVSYADYAAL
jgi:predicted deacetylase